MRWGGALVGLFVVTAAAGCGGAKPGEVAVYSSIPLQSAVGEPGSTGAVDVVRGEQVALAETGGRAGAFRVRLVSLDDSDPRTREPSAKLARRNATRAAADKRAVAYIGELHSGVTAESLVITNRANLLQVTPLATYNGLTRNEGAARGEPEKYYPGGKRTFGRVVQTDLVQAAAVLEYMRREGIRRAALFHEGTLYGSGLVQMIGELARHGPVKVFDGHAASAQRPAKAHRIDWRDAARRVAARGAQAVFYAGFPEIRRMVAIQQGAPGMKVFGSEDFVITGAETLEPIRDAGQEDLYYATAGISTFETPVARRFAAAYERRYGEPPTLSSYYGYDAMRIVIDAIRRAADRGDDREAVRRAFFATRNHDSPSGRYSIDANGDVTLRTFGAFRPRNGRWVPDRAVDVRRYLRR